MSWHRRGLSLALGLAWAGSGCTFGRKSLRFERFPQRFFAEQLVTIKADGAVQALKAQISRTAGSIDLALVDSLWGTPLLRARIPAAGGLEILFQAPQMRERKFPGQQIADAIRFLYSAPRFREEADDVYTLTAADKAYAYELSHIQGNEACRFPERMLLRFSDGRFALEIQTKEFTCDGK